jgi:hypothetical protein
VGGFAVRWRRPALEVFEELKNAALDHISAVESGKKSRSKQAGIYKQVVKCIDLLMSNPRHPGLKTHEFNELPHPYDKSKKVFEAYVQNRSPGAYRVFWCYGPEKDQITILAITPHP